MKQIEKEKLAKQNEHISTKEIKQDILDTQREINQMKEEAEHLETTPTGMSDTRFNHMKGQARRSGIESREIFIKRLNTILEIRNK